MKSAKAFCLAGAGEESLYQVQQDIDDACACFQQLEIPAEAMLMDDGASSKTVLLEALCRQWSCPDTEVAHTQQPDIHSGYSRSSSCTTLVTPREALLVPEP